MTIKQIKTFLSLFILISLMSSCEYSYYIAINNQNSPTKVIVTYENKYSNWETGDTLKIKSKYFNNLDTIIFRKNIDSTKYSFIVPEKTEVELMPRSIGTPIRKIEIEINKDSTFTVNLRDNKQMKLLIKNGNLLKSKASYVFIRK